MKNIARSEKVELRIIIMFALVFGVLIGVSHCQVFDVSIVEVTDGDTLRLKFANNFEFDARLHGIDAPEITQGFGPQAKAKLEELTDGEQLKIWVIAEDKYNRKIVKLVRANFTEINIEMIESGFAWVYSARRDERNKYNEAYKNAFVNCLGLWSALEKCLTPEQRSLRAIGSPSIPPEPCKPSKFRKSKCEEQQ